MEAMKRFDPHFLFGMASLICSTSTVAVVLAFLLKDAIQPKPEHSVFDIPLEFILLLFVFPIIHIVGLLSGLRSFWLQPNTLGIGLWAMIVSLLLLLFDFFIWFRWMS